MTPKPGKKTSVSISQSWSAEEISTWSPEKLQDFQARSERLKRPDLKEMIDAEIARRADLAARDKAAKQRNKTDGVAIEYHFVCAKDRGVTQESDGTFRTGSWKVSEGQVQVSLRVGALIALHETKADLSYRQGKLMAYRLTQRDMIEKDDFGVEFHVDPTRSRLSGSGMEPARKDISGSEND